MLDLLLTRGQLCDGTGAPARPASIGIRDGRIASIGPSRSTEAARRTIDVEGLVVAPGFVDPHTHYDAQLMWDPAATPSSLHGVTTVIGGNCGFSLAPLAPEHVDYLLRMMARVEGMPLAALEAGLAWDWTSFADYLDRFEGRVGVNAGFMVGHSAIRRAVMGAAATERAAGDDERTAIVRQLRAALDAGALGFSTSLSTTHNDGDNAPVPSRLADRAELFELAAAVRPYEGTTLEFITTGCVNGFTDDEIDIMIELSTRAARPLNWNVLADEGQLVASDRAAARGGRIVALAMPTNGPSRVCLHDYFALYSLPKWKELYALPVPERAAQFADAAVRRELDAIAQSPAAGALRGLAAWARLEIGSGALRGRIVGEVAAERRVDPFELVCELSVGDGLRTVFWTPSGLSPAHARARASLLSDPRVLIGGSDAGAHLDRMCGARYPTKFLATYARETEAMALETVVRLMTDVPARYFGLRERGRVETGWHADLVVFDPATVDATSLVLVADLPGGAERLTSHARGVAYTIVNGTPIVEHGELTGALPGTVLRAARDTSATTI